MVNDAALANGWYISRETELVGPIDDQELRGRVARGLLSREDYAWRDGMELWTQVKDLPGIGSIARVPPAPTADQPRYTGVPEAVAPNRKPKQPTKPSSKERRSEAVSRAGRPSSGNTSAPAGNPGAPWSFPGQGGGTDVVGEKLKQIFGPGFKLSPVVAALIVMGLIFPPAIVPLWLLAVVFYLRSK